MSNEQVQHVIIDDPGIITTGAVQHVIADNSLATPLTVANGGTGASTAADARTNLGLGTMAVQAANAVAVTGGSVAGITDLAVADGGTGASTAANARTNLGVGTGDSPSLSSLALSGTITPTQLAANTNDWNPTGLATALMVRISSDAARDLTGIVTPGINGKFLWLFNIGSFPITLKYNSGSSAGGNRIFTPIGADYVLRVAASVLLCYDSVFLVWVVLGA